MRSKNFSTSTAVVAYVPALHAGYLAFFRANKHKDLHLLGNSLISLTPRMDRDIRALSPQEAKQAIEGLDLFPTVSILEKRTVKNALKKYKKILLPDEDVSRNFAGAFLKKGQATFTSVFLRWDKNISTTEFVVPSDRIVSAKGKDLAFLREAAKEAVQSPDWWRQIGAVLVKGHTIILRAYNRHFPDNGVSAAFGDPRSNFDYGEHPDIYLSIHAEADIIAQAARAGVSLKNADLFVTTFPCSNCARLLARAGIRRIYYTKGYSKLDAEEVLRSANVEIVLVKTK